MFRPLQNDNEFIFFSFQIMAADEMKKNVEKLDELEESLKKAQEELIVCFVPLFTSVYKTNDHNLFCLIW